jgi:hypothetical protein
LHARADALLRRAGRVRDPELSQNYWQLTLGFRRLAEWADRHRNRDENPPKADAEADDHADPAAPRRPHGD